MNFFKEKNIKTIPFFTCLLVFLLPFMFFNPMNPSFHRLQLTEIISIPLIILFFFNNFSRLSYQKIKSYLYKETFLLFFLFLILVIGVIKSADLSSSALDLCKYIYLFFITLVIYKNSIKYECHKEIILSFVSSYIIICVCGIIGIILLYFDIQSPLAKKSMIISVALGIQDYVTYFPRVTSFFKPTANMFSAYLAVISLFCLHVIFSTNYLKK